MKIYNRRELKKILKYEKEIYIGLGYKNFFVSIMRKSQIDLIYRYIKLLRLEEFYKTKKSYKLYELYIKRKRNKLGNKLGMYIPPNTFDIGLTIYHSYGIIINSKSKIGKNCRIHGAICIGNDGKNDDNVPKLGDNVDIGVGAKIIGDVIIGNNVKIGANAVVLKGKYDNNCVLVGVPAKIIN